MKLEGRSSQKINDKLCDSNEAFRIPQNLSGSYVGFIEYSDNCEFNSEAGSAEIQVKCIESFMAMKDLKEFYGDKAFQDPELIEIMPNESLD